MTESHIVFYDLKLPNDPNFAWSPNTCKTRFTLNYKGIPYKTVWLTFFEVHSEIPKLTKSDRMPTIPVIVDKLHGDKVVQDSWEIAKYLDEAYPDTPRLFNNDLGTQLFFYNYCTKNILLQVFKLVLPNLLDKTGDMREWYVTSREAMFKTSLENVMGDPEEQAKILAGFLEPIGAILKEYPYVNGQQVACNDIMLAGYLHMLFVFRPDLFDTIVLNNQKSGKHFNDWWKKMEKYIKQE
ncbi:glutathione S-transferase [Phascolomyces articulosus]|uniref:Glutathione S-transferase n=1 Tax=Phascolomyces articulosus TaxID=60185 RepID=A0AAD5PCZ5_9FUNG|nr:glutathione S-transferase [Phascolomyces articulosus]